MSQPALLFALAALAGTLACIAVAAPPGAPDVPAPFEPVRVLEASNGATVVGVWGRRYRFVAGPLPEAVESQGEPLFARPPAFRLEGARVQWTRTAVASAGPEAVVLHSESIGKPMLRAETRIEYDGMIRVALHAEAADRPVHIGSLLYELTLPRDAARFYNHHLVYDFQQRVIDKRGLLAAAGALADGSRRLRFVPSLFLGGRRIGLEWWAETNAPFEGPCATEPIEIVTGPTDVRLRIEPVTGPLHIGAGGRWTHEFALFPAPLRAPPRRWRSLRLISQGPSMADFDTGIGTRFVSIIHSAQFPPRWHGLPHSRRDTPRAVREASVQPVEVIVDDTSPEWIVELPVPIPAWVDGVGAQRISARP